MPDASGPEKSAAAGPPVGRVVGTEDSTPLQFSVAVDPDAYLQLDDVVVTVRAVPGREPVTTAGVVTEVRARHEGASRLRRLPGRRRHAARAGAGDRRGHHDAGRARGLRAAVARRVRLRATGEERAKALYFDQMERKVAAGLGRDGDPIYLNLEFLDGTRGGHVSISGISGVATKTSFALFLLYSIFTGGALKNALNAKALVFSVKGEDLLFLDHANRRLDEDLRAAYATLGLRPRRSRRSGSSPRRPRTTSRAARTSSAAPAG